MMKDATNQLEKIIFSAVFGKTIAATNMSMGLRHLTVAEVLANTDIDRFLVPFDDDERSYTRVMVGRFVLLAILLNMFLRAGLGFFLTRRETPF